MSIEKRIASEDYVNSAIANEAIKSPLTAAVGQTIVVKAIDESGKPIEWECVDMAAGGGSGAGLPAVTEADNGKILMVVDGVWQAVAISNAEGGLF
jgi:hypothetical protein